MSMTRLFQEQALYRVCGNNDNPESWGGHFTIERAIIRRHGDDF